MPGDATTQMTLRRRNPKGGRHFAGLDARIHFSAPF
jgi:hypothetical protein